MRHHGRRACSDLTPFRGILERLRLESQRYFGVPHVVLEAVTMDSRRFSDVLRIRITADGASSYAFVKILKPQSPGPNHDDQERLRRRVSAEYTMALRVRQHFEGRPGLSAVRPIALIPEHCALVTEQVSGETFLRLLARQAGWWPRGQELEHLCAVAERVGTWLRTFQELDPPKSRVSLDAFREYVDWRLVRLVRLASIPNADRSAILRYVDDQLGRIPKAELAEVLIHADLALSNILIDGLDVTVLDFGEPRYDATHHDLTHVVTQLDLLSAKPQIRRSVVESLQAALLAGFDPALDPSQPLFRLLRLKHVLCHFLTLATRSGRGVERGYNWYLCQRHRAWLKAEIARSRGGTEWPVAGRGRIHAEARGQ
jgi:hypothetical protein